MACLPEPCCADCGGKVVPNGNPAIRHQVFELPEPKLNITEYQVFAGRCQHCGSPAKGKLPKNAPEGQIGPRLLSYIAVLAGQYHLSVRKIQRLLKDQYQEHFSIGAISEAQGKISSMLTPTHQALHQHTKRAKLIHADETSHNRNGEQHTRWIWLSVTADAVYQSIRWGRDQGSAKHLLGDSPKAVVVTDQCASYNWLDEARHQFCWAHIERNLQKMADYSGGGLTAQLGKQLVLICKAVFRTHHRYEQNSLAETVWKRRMHRLRKTLRSLLLKGKCVPAKLYAGRCQFIMKHETSLWVFLEQQGVPLTNNEAERCIRGSVIMRKICYGTSSDRGEKFRSRLLSVVETCKKRRLSPLAVVSQIATAVVAKQPYPDVFNLAAT